MSPGHIILTTQLSIGLAVFLTAVLIRVTMHRTSSDLLMLAAVLILGAMVSWGLAGWFA